MSLFEVKYQVRAQRLLQRALAAQRVPHAYIFSGPDGVGKRTLAGQVAKMLVCSDRQRIPWPTDAAGPAVHEHAVDACGRCDDCRWMAAQTHPDFHRVYKELVREIPEKQDHKATAVSIDVIRRFLLEPVSLKPSRGRAKVFLIEEAEKLSVPAQNAMLKTLEEPPGNTFIVLLTTSWSRLLPTTLSRCQMVPFGTLPVDFVVAHLTEKCQVDAAQAWYLSRRSGGRLGLAVQWAAQGCFPMKQEVLRRIADISLPEVAPVAKWMADTAEEMGEKAVKGNPTASGSEVTRESLGLLLGAAGSLLRDAMLLIAGGDPALMENRDQGDLVRRVAERLGITRAGELIRELAETERFLAGHANSLLAVENWLLQFAEPFGQRRLSISAQSR